MSPDDIFAAHMWPWPDPMLKRDPMGRVIFVNAAFLQLYGGRIENWTGHPVQGWPTPSPQGMPYRFETRAGQGESEIIYDWVETILADGNAVALARDVTVFHQQTAPLAAPEPVPAPPQAAAPPPPAAHVPQPPIYEPAPHSDAAPQFQQPVAAAPEEPQYRAPIEPAPIAPPVEIPAPHVELVAAPPAPEPQRAAAPEPEPLQQPHQPVEASQPSYEPEPKREFERRALPIENGDAVLGSNWRDAVIARAIGASDEPAASAQSSAPVSQNHDSPITATGEGLKILLAEDNAINALLTRTLLEAEGCTVETVEDGLEAVAAMENGRYDLIFMDMRMPNMDGLEATRKIRAMGTQASKLPIIALTANAFDDDRNACFDSGMNDFMTKPVSADELSNMVQMWTKKRDELQSSAA